MGHLGNKRAQVRHTKVWFSSLLLASHSQQCTRRETLHLCSLLAYCWVLTQLCENIHGQQTTASSSYAFKLKSKQNFKVAILYTFVIYCPECTAMTWAFPIKYSLHTTGGLKLGHWSHTWQVLAASDDRLSCASHKGVYQETMWGSPIASQSLRQGDVVETQQQSRGWGTTRKLGYIKITGGNRPYCVLEKMCWVIIPALN